MPLHYVALEENPATGQYVVTDETLHEEGFETVEDLWSSMTSDGSKLYKIGTDALPPEMADIRGKVAENVVCVAGFQVGLGEDPYYFAVVER